MASLEKSKQTVMEEMKSYLDKMSLDIKPLIIMDGARGLWSCVDKVFGKNNYIGRVTCKLPP